MEIQARIGLGALTNLAFQGADMDSVRANLLQMHAMQPENAGHLMDLSVVEQLRGNLPLGLRLQTQALDICRVFSQKGQAGKTRVLVLAAPIEMGGNTPIDFLTDSADFEVVTWYVNTTNVRASDFPEHDVVFIAAPGDCGPNEAYLQSISNLLTNTRAPILNTPTSIAKLDRGVLTEHFDGSKLIRCPRTLRYSRNDMIHLVLTGATDPKLENLGAMPWVIRPVGSHAGRGLARVDNTVQLKEYLEDHNGEEAFFLSEFIDYRSCEDGLYRKYRVVFVDGQPFPCHMAVSDEWKLWYLNAGMDASVEKRQQEQAFMDGFRDGFAARHKTALDALSNTLGLDYFGIDCAEDQNGSLILFEADNALLVHDMDPPHIYPYKRPHMTALFSAFQDMLHRAANTSQP